MLATCSTALRCDALLARGDDVVVVDNFLTGQRKNIEKLFTHERFTFLEHDVTQPFTVDGHLDAVMNLASPASPDDFLRIPLEIMAVGSVGTKNLLDIAVAKKARYFLASTSEVYGDPLVHPQNEEYWGNVDPIGPRSCYDEAKRFSEAMTMAYHRTHGLDVRIVRIFNTYGPRMKPDDGRVVGNFCVAAILGKPITLYGTGPCNIGNPVEFTLRELAELVVELTGSSSEIVVVPMPPERIGDPMQRQPDLTLATTALGWKPEVDLREGLTHMIAWLRTQKLD
jgi:nucleoside-diphosphate-sugar epimerase